MKRAKQIVLALAVLFGLAQRGQATVIVDNTWVSGTRTEWSVPGGEAPWLSDSSSAFNLAILTNYLGIGNNALCVTNYPAGSVRNFWTYFTTNAPELTVPFGDGTTTNAATGTTNKFYGYPVEIGVGQKLVVTMVLYPSNVLASGTSFVRFGLLNYENASDFGRPSVDNNIFKSSGTNVTGYRFGVAMYQSFAPDPGQATLQFLVRATNAVDAQEPLGKAGPWFSLGSRASMTNAPGFQEGGEYTLQFTVSRYAASSNVLSAQVSGIGLGLQASQVDTSGSNYCRFDAFAMRTNPAESGAYLYVLREFKVELLPLASSVPPFQITAQGFVAPNEFRIVWDSVADRVYQIQSRDSLGAGDWTTNATVTASGVSASWTNTGISGVTQRYYRVVNTP